MKSTSVIALLLFPTGVLSKAILGVDLGSLYMKVALVKRNSPLEIVTNMHSKRKTEQMVLFDSGTRFYGADANSLVARKPTKTPQSMGVFLGRDEDHPTAKVLEDRHYAITAKYNETRSGVCLTIDGQPYTPEELVAMVLTHAKDITVAYGVGSPVKDCVLTVPSFYTQHERRALLDAALLADLNVLALIDENTAAGLHFGIDRVDDEHMNVLFYNMGASALQVSVVQYHSYDRKEGYGKPKKVGSFQVLGKAWDATLGGGAFDARIVDFMADEFNEVWNKKRNDGEVKDIRKYPRPMAKLKIQATKIKQVLSANTDMPIFIDSLYDDTNYQSHLSRSKFEEMCHDLMLRSAEPIDAALKSANMTLDDIDAVELIGGGMRIPKIQEQIKDSLGGKVELGMHINSDESMALGAAFHGANISTAFRVRHVGMADINPFPIAISLEDMKVDEKNGLFGMRNRKEEEDQDEEKWSKHATIFKSNGKVGVKKTIAFTHDRDVVCAIDYEENDSLPEGTGLGIERYNITGITVFADEMQQKNLGKPKISLQFELSGSGLTQLVKAEAVVEETITVQEEVEVDDDEEEVTISEEDTSSEVDASTTTEDKKEDVTEKDTVNETETEEHKNETKSKKKKKIMVEKEQKKLHKRPLIVKSYFVGNIQPYSDERMEESQSKLAELDRQDMERQQLEETRNKYESYIYYIKNKLIDDEEQIVPVTTEEQRDALLKSAADAEDWMYDEGYDADLATYQEQYEILSAPAEKVFFRALEATSRPEAVEALKKKLSKVEELMVKWESSKPQVSEEERAEVLAKVDEVRQSLQEKEDEQSAADPTEDPVYTSAEVPLMTKGLESLVGRLNKKPKPAPPKKEKKNETEEVDSATNETDANTEEEESAKANEKDEASDETSEKDTDGDEEL